MKLPVAKKLFNLGVIAALLVALLCIPSNDVYSQSKAAANKLKQKKPIRVFYGQASFYANKFNGRKTASGEIFDQRKFTCASNVLPLGTWIKVTNLNNGRTAVVKINDRIHPKMKRIVDVSRAAAVKLGYISRGLTRVKIELLDKRQVPRN